MGLLFERLDDTYTRAGLVVAGAVVVSLVVRHIVFPLLRRVAGRTRTRVDAELLRVSSGSVELLIILIGVRRALEMLYARPLLPGESLPVAVANTAIVLCFAHLLVRCLDAVVDVVVLPLIERTDTSIDDAIVPVVHRLSRVGIFIAAALAVLSAWGVQVGKVWAGLGIAGLAIGFAVKDSLSNVFGGISLMFDRAYKPGDFIKLESGDAGIVEDVGLRSTRIRTWDNERITVPNGMMATSRVQNYHQPDRTERVRVDFGVVYGSDPDEVKRVALGTLDGVEGILADPPPDCWFLEMADFALKFQLRFYVDDVMKKWAVFQIVIDRLYKALYANDIGIPFPTRTIYIHQPAPPPPVQPPKSA